MQSVSSIIDEKSIISYHNGYRSTRCADAPPFLQDNTTDEYAYSQMEFNIQKTIDFIIPIIDASGGNTLLDIGCGVGTMTRILGEKGYDAYGVDVPELSKRWAQQNLSKNNYFVIDPIAMKLPFFDGSVDFAFSLGVIEHVGTSNGHSDRLPDYHTIRSAWLREIFRTIRVGGYMLIGGPNRHFPIDVAHGLDSKASLLEKSLSRMVSMSVHKTWGENFLWAYPDFDVYLAALPYELEALNIYRYLQLSRVPPFARSFVGTYLKYMPKVLLRSGFNPWVMSLLKRTA